MNETERPGTAESALKAVEEAHRELRAAAEKLNAAMANLMALVVVENVRKKD